MAKKLLNEAVVRRFQSLANISPLNEMYHKRDEDEKMEEAYMEGEGEEVMKEEEEAEMPELDDAPAEMPEEEPMAMDGDLELTDEEAQAIIELGQKLEAAMGEEAEEMDAEAPAMDAEMGEEEPEEMMEDLLEGISYEPSRKELVNEVAKRVAKRLHEAKLHEAKLNRALGRK